MIEKEKEMRYNMGKSYVNDAKYQAMSYAEKIDFFAAKSNLISVNNGNGKTGKGCLTLSVPTITCAPDAPCRKGCYCMKGRQTIPGVCGAYYRNYRIWCENPKGFEEQLIHILKYEGLPLFRWHDAGEIPDKEYLSMMFRVAIKFPNISFLAYTKKYDLVNEFLNEHVIPENLCIRLSAWDKDWEVPNPHNLPMAYVDFTDKTKNPSIPRNAFKCKGGSEYTCTTCRMCFKKEVISVVFKQH